MVGVLLISFVMPGCVRTDAATSFNLSPDPQDDTRVSAVVEGGAAAALRRHLKGATSGARLDEVFYLSLKEASKPVPVLARIEWTGDRARLVPSVPLTRGQTYVAVFDAPRLSNSFSAPLTSEYRVPVDARSSPSTVTAVFPNQPVLPANLLKFYVHFSEPMAEGQLFQYARLLDADGRPVMQAFREVELWGDHHRRVTLWINPGRTKQALGLSESLGPVLVPDRDYTLEITAGLPDAAGRPLAKPFRLPFHTGPADHTQPVIDTWQITTPASGTSQPLQVRFSESLDHALAQVGIKVETADGKPVPGRVQVDAASTRWTFTPEAPWRPGQYQLSAAGEVEDLAGNSFYRPFETTAGQGARPNATPPVFRRGFHVE